jgi:hypothetical protein
MYSRALVHSAILLGVALVGRADAQTTPDPSAADPRVWVSASAGRVVFPQLNFLNDLSRENIGSATGIRGTVEADIGKVGGLGITYAIAEFPVEYVVSRLGDPCIQGCAAKLNTTTLMATLRVGGGLGLEQIFEASAGLMMFDEMESSQPLTNARGKATDFTAAVGYGASYGFTPRLSVMVLADLGLVFHDNPNDEADISGTSYSHYVGLRAGLRYGLFSR